jgi:class 3 adenylate cyclase
MRGPYLIAVCDILGFSELVERHSLDSVVDDAVGWFRKALNHSLLGGTFAASPPQTRELENHPHVSVAWFSDTILLYTKHDTDVAVGELLQAVGSLLFETILGGVTKIRAGIAYGEAHMDPANSIYVGLPIVEAYRLEKRQQWAGAALAPSACARLAACGPSGEIARWWVTSWDVPLEGGASTTTLAVNWNRCVHDPIWRLRWSESSEMPTDEASLSLKEKFMNTKRFHEALCEDCNRREA